MKEKKGGRQRNRETQRERERERGLTSFQLVFELLNASLVGKNSVSGWPARAQTHEYSVSDRKTEKDQERKRDHWNFSID